jgi:hypothetical protein
VREENEPSRDAGYVDANLAVKNFLEVLPTTQRLPGGSLRAVPRRSPCAADSR